MKLLALIAVILPVLGFSQIIRVQDGLIFDSESDIYAIDDAFDNCWCYAETNDSTKVVENVVPITFPLPVEKGGQWGAVDENGKLIHAYSSPDPILYTDKGKVLLQGFEAKNYNMQVTENARMILLDSTEAEISRYHVADVFKGTFIASKDQRNWGLIDSKFKELTELKYVPAHHDGEQFHFSSKGYWSTRENAAGSYFGAFNHKGKKIIPFKWKLISYVIEDEDHIYVMNEYLKRGYINIKGQTTLQFIYSTIPRVLTDSNRVTTEKYVTFLDKNLNQIGPKYQAYEKKGKLWFYKIGGKWGIKDINNETVIPHQYSSIMDGPRIKDDKDFKCYIVVKSGKYGLINLDGTSIIAPAYECLCGLGYYAPASYYIEFQKAGVSYKFDKAGELIEKGGKSGGSCFCE